MGSDRIPVAQRTATSLAIQVMEFLALHRLAPSPRNYRMIYAYFEGVQFDLINAIDRHLRGAQPLDDAVLARIDEAHPPFCESGLRIGAEPDLQATVDNLLRNIREAGEGASMFDQALRTSLAQLEGESPSIALNVIAASMLNSTRSIMARNSQLQTSLETTLAETVTLRDELEQRRHDALIDPLTGLSNRRALDARITELLADAEDSKRRFCVLIIDIDHFKSVNDNYGHSIGDEVIRNVAAVIRQSVRSVDLAVRYGGEEFIVLAPDTRRSVAVALAHSIGARVSAMRLKRVCDDKVLTAVTLSIGVAEYSGRETAFGLLARADRALYLAKDGGRNRVEFDFPDPVDRFENPICAGVALASAADALAITPA